MEIYPLFKPVSATPREVIYARGEPSYSLFFLLKGRCEAISAVDSTPRESCNSRLRR